jgi:hypothetical protein
LITLLVLYCAAGVLLVVLSIPLMLKKIPPNPIYGFRVSQTLENSETWYAVNQYAARRLVFTGASTVMAAIGLYFIPSITVDGYALACLAVFAVVFITGLVQSFRYLRSLS